MNIEKNLRVGFVIVCLAFLWSLALLNIKTTKLNEKTLELEKVQVKRDSLQRIYDSIYNENFSYQIDLTRYQVAYEIFLERNPKAASQFDDIISKETE